MKTTIDFPDDLLHQAKIVAAKRGTSLRNLMIQALRQVTDTSNNEEEAKRKATFRQLLKKMKAANTKPMRPLTREEIHVR